MDSNLPCRHHLWCRSCTYLHEFKADQVHNIVNHSEARLLFVGDQIWENLNEAAMPHLEGIIELKDFGVPVSRSEKLAYARDHLNEIFGHKIPPADSVLMIFLMKKKNQKTWPSLITLQVLPDIPKA